MILRNVNALIFADTDALASAAQDATKDPRLSRSHLEIHQGGVLAAAQWLAEHHSPDILFVSDPIDDGLWDRMERLADSVEPGCRVVVIGPRDNIAVFREMVARGVADYLGGEVSAADIVDCMARLFIAEEGLPKGRLVTVIPAVGGAGGSTVAAVAAFSLAQRLGDTILLDLDLPMGTGALMMGTDPRDPLSSALANPGLDAAMLERFISREGSVRILSTPGALGEARTLDADTVERVVSLARSMAKVVVVDMPRGWGEGWERVVTQSDEVVVVARPDLASLRNSRMIVEDVAGRRIDGRRPRLVLNGVGAAKKNEYGAADFTEAAGVAPAAVAPFDPEPLMAAIAEGRPIVQAKGKAMAALLAFADGLLEDGTKQANKKKAAGSDPLAPLKAKLAKLMKKEKA
ncbi:MAG: AAA family ATPase [Solirubrobacterales bacterium]